MDNADAYLADLARQGIPATEGESALVRMVWKEATERAAGIAETERARQVAYVADGGWKWREECYEKAAVAAIIAHSIRRG